jgi:hypothetical protein
MYLEVIPGTENGINRTVEKQSWSPGLLYLKPSLIMASWLGDSWFKLKKSVNYGPWANMTQGLLVKF